MMQVKLDLLVPSWVLQYDSWKQFLQVLEENLNEIGYGIDQLVKVYDVLEENQFIKELADNFAFGQFLSVGTTENAIVLDNVRGFIELQGSREFFDRILQLFGGAVSVKDLSEEIMILSSGRRLSEHHLEDARYYRDASIEVTVSVADFFKLWELFNKFLPAGCYVWFDVVMGGLGFMSMGVRGYWEEGTGFALTMRDTVRLRTVLGNGYARNFSEQAKFYVDLGNGYARNFSEQAKFYVDLGNGYARNFSEQTQFKAIPQVEYCLRDEMDTRCGFQAQSWYMVANEWVVPLG
jgi:hypothetical protein